MNINYSMDHKLLAFPCFEDAPGRTPRFALLMVFSQIVHFCHNTKGKFKSCEVKINQMADDMNCRSDFFSKALRILESHDMIKCIKPHQRKTNEAGVYQTTGAYVSVRARLYPTESQAGSHREGVYNIKQYYKKGVVNTPPSSNGNNLPTADITSIVNKNIKTEKNKWE